MMQVFSGRRVAGFTRRVHRDVPQKSLPQKSLALRPDMRYQNEATGKMPWDFLT